MLAAGASDLRAQPPGNDEAGTVAPVGFVIAGLVCSGLDRADARLILANPVA